MARSLLPRFGVSESLANRVLIVCLAAVVAVVSSWGPVEAGVIDLTRYAANPSDCDPQGEAPLSAGAAKIEGWLGCAIENYNALPTTDLPTDTTTLFRNNQFQDNGPAGADFPVFGSGLTAITIPILWGHQYVVLHWGQGAGTLTPDYQVFFVSREPGFTSTEFRNADQQGLSFYSVHGVPDGGATLVLLGCALLGLGLLHRRTRR